MAVVSQLPAPEVITYFRGVLDYAYWRGLYYVRQWPKWKGAQRSPAVAAAGAQFATISRALSLTDPLLQAAWKVEGAPTWTWKDAATSSIYGNSTEWPT